MARGGRIAVVAFGGNALLPRDADGTQEEQETMARQAAAWLTEVIQSGYDLVVVHGNGPQVGNNLIRIEQSVLQIPPLSLDVAVAETQGSIGFFLQTALRSELQRRHIDKDVVTLLTEVEVDGDDPAFGKPTKPVGPFFNRYRAKVLAEERRWTMVEDAGRGYRKVVASPRPRRILNFEVIRQLVKAGTVTIAAGGGGIPVVRGRDGMLKGVEAVIDKDYTSSLLAAGLKADLFIVLTGVPRVMRDYGKPTQVELPELSVSQAKRLMRQGQFPPGSMGPKIDAAVRFVEGGGRAVLITDAPHLGEALAGRSGTWIRPVRRGKRAAGTDRRRGARASDVA